MGSIGSMALIKRVVKGFPDSVLGVMIAGVTTLDDFVILETSTGAEQSRHTLSRISSTILFNGIVLFVRVCAWPGAGRLVSPGLSWNAVTLAGLIIGPLGDWGGESPSTTVVGRNSDAITTRWFLYELIVNNEVRETERMVPD